MILLAILIAERMLNVPILATWMTVIVRSVIAVMMRVV
jgi:hypothetical protein